MAGVLPAACSCSSGAHAHSPLLPHWCCSASLRRTGRSSCATSPADAWCMMAAAAVAGNMSLARWCIWGWGRGGAGGSAPACDVVCLRLGFAPRTNHAWPQKASRYYQLVSVAPPCIAEGAAAYRTGCRASSASPVQPAGRKSAMHAKRRCQLCEVAWNWYIVWQVPDRHVDTGVFQMLAGGRSTAGAFRRRTSQPTRIRPASGSSITITSLSNRELAADGNESG